ncbi:MAG TPA: iron-sulfur cluster assembly scaffold protein [Anaerolineales bacterium]|nr:iron-sulfur cluster assembly scaffold protein [Anaerolineales bacterium]
MDDLARQQMIERYKFPRFRGHLAHCDASYEDENPLCGDHVQMELAFDSAGKVSAAAFDGRGCTLSQVSADLLTEHAIGKTRPELQAVSKEDVLELLGVDNLGPNRIKCALLALKVMKAAVYGVDAPAG